MQALNLTIPFHTTREQWLSEAIEKLRPLFRSAGKEIPKVRVSVGFPGGGSARKRIGEYWHAESCSDNVPQIFISPTLDKPTELLDVLVHELVHAVTPGAGHGPAFKAVALGVGLSGPMRATTAGPELIERLKELEKELGKLPHAGINLSDRKKQTTRLIKCACECGYTIRTTQKWLEERGAPICPCSGKQMQISL